MKSVTVLLDPVLMMVVRRRNSHAAPRSDLIYRSVILTEYTEHKADTPLNGYAIFLCVLYSHPTM